MPAFVRPPLTEVELIQAGNDLLYEGQMLSNTAELLDPRSERWNRGWDQKTLYMATLESFLVHARSLMDFFCPADGYDTNPRRATDRFASDFCSAWTPERWDGFKEDWDNISTEIMHMTGLRPEVGRNWPYGELLLKLNAMLSQFLDAADRLHPHLQGELRGILAGSRTSTAYNPALEHGAWPIDPAVLTGMNPLTSVPTTTAIDPSVIHS